MLSATLVVLALLAAWMVAKSEMHDEVCRTIECGLAEQSPGLRVSVGSARVIEGSGVEIHGVRIADKDSRTELVYVDEIFAACPISLEGLLKGEKPQAQRIVLRGLKAWAKQLPDGTWNLDRLWPMPKLGNNSPPITVTDGELEIAVADNGGWSTFTLRNVDLEATPERTTASSRQMAAGAHRPPVQIRGSFEGDHFDTVNLDGRYDPNTGAWETVAAAEGLQLSPKLHADLPATWREKVASAASISGQLKIEVHLAKKAAKEAQIDFEVSGTLTDGQIADPRLPVRLYDAKAEFYCDNRRLIVESFSARNGDTSLDLTFQQNGYTEDSPKALWARATKLTLDKRFIDFLPNEPFPLRRTWLKYYPIGVVDAEISLGFDGRQWTPGLHMICHDVSFTYHKFPYRLDRGRGTVSLKDDVLKLGIQAIAGGQVVDIRGAVAQPVKHPTGSVTVTCEQPIPVDNKLLSAIVEPPTTQRLIRSFNPGGTISVVGTFTFDGLGKAGTHKDVEIGLHNCAVQYAKFPYPLGMINGIVRWNDKGWFFDNISGYNDSGYIECKGSLTRTRDGESILALTFVGIDVPIEDELRDSLNPNTAQLWNDLRPRGSIDHLMVDLRHVMPANQLSLTVRAQQWEQRQKGEGRSITIHPKWFPYRLDDVAGVATYVDGLVTLEGMSAKHDETRITLNGRCNFTKDGPWQLSLTDIKADRVHFDRELLDALPRELGRAAGKLHLRGNVNLTEESWLTFAGHAGARHQTAANWNVKFDIENGSMQCGLQLEHIHGDVQLFGGSGPQGFSSRGLLNVDSMFYKDIQLTNVTGPLLINQTHILLGAESERGRTVGAPRQVTAKVFGGDLSVDAVVKLDSETPYLVQARLQEGDLGLLAQEMALKNRNVRGKVNALVNLGGNGYGRDSWRGDGLVRLYDADIYKVPVMLSLLKFLTISPPDTTAFTSSEIDFRIEGEQVYLDKINFHGDAVSLKGYGEMNLDRQIDLKFYTLVGQREFDWQLLRYLVQQASSQILAIRVTGTLDDPDPRQLPLPAIKDALQQLFPEVAKKRQERQELGLPTSQPFRRMAERLRIFR